jgi:flagellin-like protein
MNKKGISPIVAAVILIALTMVIAGVLAFWVSGFMRSATTTTEMKRAEVEKCSVADFSIYHSSFNQGEKKLALIFENKANVELNLTEIDIVTDGNITVFPLNVTLRGVGGSLNFVTVENVENCTSFRVLSECSNVFREGKC